MKSLKNKIWGIVIEDIQQKVEEIYSLKVEMRVHEKVSRNISLRDIRIKVEHILTKKKCLKEKIQEKLYSDLFELIAIKCKKAYKSDEDWRFSFTWIPKSICYEIQHTLSPRIDPIIDAISESLTTNFVESIDDEILFEN
jgi:hypothetical protein